MQLSPLRGLHQDCRVSMPPSSVERGGDEEQENLALSAFARLSQYQDRDRGSLAALSRQTPALAGNETVGARDSTAQASDILSNAGKSGATGGSPSRIKGNPLDTKSIFAGISGNRGATAEEIQQQNAPKTFVQKSFAKVTAMQGAHIGLTALSAPVPGEECSQAAHAENNLQQQHCSFSQSIGTCRSSKGACGWTPATQAAGCSQRIHGYGRS
jgi:hypothetical protein